MAQTMLDVSKNVSRTFNEYEVQKTFADSLLRTYSERAEHAKNAAALGSEELTDENWLQVAIASQISQEKRHYYGQFGDAFISATVLSELQVMIDDMSDSLKGGGLDGFGKVASDALEFDTRFRFAMYLQRKLGWTKGLSRALRTRFETLSAMRLAVKAQLTSDSDALVAMVGQSAANEAKSLYKNRLRAIETSLSSIRLQYPEYSKNVQERSLGRVALRLEERDYDTLLKRGLISEDV
jgi:CPA1 family monovalent cation:H+ antiporter